MTEYVYSTSQADGKFLTPEAANNAYVAVVPRATGNVAVDDAALQAKLDAASGAAGQAYVVLGNETRYTAGNIAIASNTALVGCGAPVSVLKLAAGTAVKSVLTNSDVTGNVNILIRDLAIDGNRANQTGAADDPNNPHYGLLLQQVANLTLENVDVSNVHGTGIFVTGNAVQTRVVHYVNVNAHDNDLDGIWTGNAMREVHYGGVYGRNNARHGVVIDHSEAIVNAAHGHGNGGFGIWVRNVHGCGLWGLSASANQQHGIYVIGLNYSVGGNWKSYSNGKSGSGWSDVYFDEGDVTPGYGPSTQSLIVGVGCGYDPQFSGSRSEDYALYVADGLAGYDLKVIGVQAASSGNLGDIRVPAGATKLHVSGLPSGTNHLTTWTGDYFIRNGYGQRIEGAATAALPSAATAGEGAQNWDKTVHRTVFSDGTSWRYVAFLDNVVNANADYSMGVDDNIVQGNGTVTISLPSPVSVLTGRRYTVKNVGASLITVNSQGTSKTIDGAASVKLGPNDYLVVYSNASQWQIESASTSAPVATKTASYSLAASDRFVLMNGSGLTASLPGPGSVSIGRTYTVKNLNASALTVNSQGTSKTIDGAASLTLAQWEVCQAISDGTQWYRIV